MVEKLSVTKNIKELMELYGIPGEIVMCLRTEGGHINDTYYVVALSPIGARREFIFQRVNTSVFTEPLKIMHNISVITEHIARKYGKGSKESTQIISYLHNEDGRNYSILSDGSFWRVSEYVVGVGYEQIDDPSILKNAGYMFGNFQNMLSDLDTDMLAYTIPNFHNTSKRFEAFDKSVNEDVEGRVVKAQKEIKFFYDNREIADKLVNLEKTGVLPLRVTHNDTKYNNMLVNPIYKTPLCVLDLDTVMPGLSAHDYGDAIRCAANTSVEDETDLSRVALDKEYFEAFTEGFVGAAKDFLTPDEVDSLALGAVTITYELASRFLADYLNGDTYFKISRSKHNLERARCQIRLAEDMMANYDYMSNTIKRYYQ